MSAQYFQCCRIRKIKECKVQLSSHNFMWFYMEEELSCYIFTGRTTGYCNVTFISNVYIHCELRTGSSSLRDFIV